VLVLLALAGVAWWWAREHRTPSSSGAPTASVAGTTGALVVLPSRDLSGAPGGQLVGDGIAETLAARLGRLQGIHVVPANAVVAAVDRRGDPLAAARSVGARLAVQSSLMRSGEAVRIAYQVWDVAQRTQVAAGTVDGTATDLFGMQDRLAASVGAALRPASQPATTATASSVRAPSGLDSAAAQEQYLQAIGALQRADKASAVDQAIAILEPLAAAHPGSALAFAGLGRAYLARYKLTKDASWAQRARVAAETAHRLDPAVVEADVTLGQTLMAVGDAPHAEEAFRRALASDPGNLGALVGLGNAREAAKDAAGAEASYRRAIALQPYAFDPYNQLGGFYFAAGRYREAAAVFKKLSEMTPDSPRAFLNLGGALTMSCDLENGSAAYRRALELDPQRASAISNLGMNQLWTGHPQEAVQLLEKASRQTGGDYRIWSNLGDAYRDSGRAADAASAYERSTQLAREGARLNPQDGGAWSCVAATLAKRGQLADAKEPLARALSLGADDPYVLVDAAVVAIHGGDRATALDLVARAVKAGYCLQVIADTTDFASLRTDPKFRSLTAASPAPGSL
jgi:Flp pilus assembly protein TadD/TolB-like protein